MLIWVYTPCNTGGINQRFGGTYCLHLQGTRCRRNAGQYLQYYTAYKSRRSTSESSQPWKPQNSRGLRHTLKKLQQSTL